VVLQHLHTGDRLRTLRFGESIQGLGYGFFFVPVNVLAYSQLRPTRTIGLPVSQTFSGIGRKFRDRLYHHRRGTPAPVHQTNLGSAIGATSQQLAGRFSELTNYLVTKGFSGPDAAAAAQGYLYQQLQHQVSLLSFMDCFRVIAWVTLAAVPLLLFVRRFKPAGKAPATH